MPINLYSDINESIDGLLSVIKYNIPYTDETINVGVILQNSITNEIKIKTIDDFKVFKKCFALEDIENFEYSLDIINKRQIKIDNIFNGKISNSLYISEPNRYKFISKTIEEEITNVFSKKVTLSKNITKKRNLNQHSKTVYISNIKNKIKEKNLDKIIKTRKHINTDFGESKEISFLSYTESNPIIASQLISVYVDFWNNFNSALLLKYINYDSIEEKIIYMPLTNGTNGLNDKINFVREESIKEGFKLIDTSDSDEFIEYVKNKTQIAL